MFIVNTTLKGILSISLPRPLDVLTLFQPSTNNYDCRDTIFITTNHVALANLQNTDHSSKCAIRTHLFPLLTTRGHTITTETIMSQNLIHLYLLTSQHAMSKGTRIANINIIRFCAFGRLDLFKLRISS